jgi:hypothetical protein
MLARLGQVLCWVACGLMLVGCSYKTKWRDTTNQGRDQTQAFPDAMACETESGMAAINAVNKESSKAEIQAAIAENPAAFAKLKLCMANRGWELVRDDS